MTLTDLFFLDDGPTDDAFVHRDGETSLPDHIMQTLSQIPTVESSSDENGDGSRESRRSITFGIFGEWGSGKTSLLRTLFRKYSEETTSLPVWFEPQRYEHENNLVVTLISELIQEILAKTRENGLNNDRIKQTSEAVVKNYWKSMLRTGAIITDTMAGTDIERASKRIIEDAESQATARHQGCSVFVMSRRSP